MNIEELDKLTDNELNALWAKQFGGEGKWAQNETKLNIDFTALPEATLSAVGRVAAYYHTTEVADPFCFYARILGVPNRPVMLRILAETL